MKWNPKLLAIMAIAAISAMTISAKMQKAANTGATNGKEVAGIAGNELVIAKTTVQYAGQIGQLDVAQLAIVKEYSAPVASSIASKDALANAPNTATVPVDQVAASATYVTDQLALKITASAAKYAFATTGESVQSGTS